MPKFHKKQGRWLIRFKKNNKDPKEKSESLPIETPVQTVRKIEGQMNAAYYDDWDPWTYSWKEYQNHKQMQRDGVLDSGLTLAESIDVYIDKLSIRGRINSEESEANYRSTLDRLASFLGAGFMLRDLSPRHAEMFLRSLNVKQTSLAEYATRLSVFYKYWNGRGMIKETFQYNSRQKPREDTIKYITESQKNKILEQYRKDRESIARRSRGTMPPEWMDYDDIIDVIFYQGFRKSEIFSNRIRRKDVDIGAGTVRVLGKGNKYRVIDITPPAAGHFRRSYLATSAPEDIIVPGSYWKMYDILKSLATKALGPEYDWLSPHNLRHSCGTYWAGLGVPIATIRKLLGHSSIDTTMIYAKITDASSKSHFDQAYNKSTPITNIGSDTTGKG